MTRRGEQDRAEEMKGRQGRGKRGVEGWRKKRKMEEKAKVSGENRTGHFKKTSRSDQRSCQQAAGRQNWEIVAVLFLQKSHIMLGGAAEPLSSGGKNLSLQIPKK